MTPDLCKIPSPSVPYQSPLRAPFPHPKAPPPIPKKKPPVLLTKKPPPSKLNTLSTSNIADEIPATKLHWTPISDVKVKGTVWEVIGKEGSGSDLSASQNTNFSASRKQTSSDHQAHASPRAIINCESNTMTNFSKFVLPEQMLKKHFFKKNPKKEVVQKPSVAAAKSKLAKPAHGPSVLNSARLYSVSICLKGLRLESVDKIQNSLNELFNILENVSYGNLTQEHLNNKATSNESFPAATKVTAADARAVQNEISQISSQRHARLLNREELALVAENWPTNEEAKKLLQLKSVDQNAHPVDLFLLQLLHNGSLKTKVEALLCRIQVELEMRRLIKVLAKVMKCSDLLIESLSQGGLLNRVLEAVLNLGNALNNTTIRGFRIKSLRALKECRAANAKHISLLSVLATSIVSSGIDFGQFQEELLVLASALKEVADIDLNQTAADLGAVVSKLDKAEKDLIGPSGGFGLASTPKSGSSCSSTKDSSCSLDTDSTETDDAQKFGNICSDEEVLEHLALFIRWAEGVTTVLQKQFFSSKDRLTTICKLLGETGDKVINIVSEDLSSFLSNIVQACKAEYMKQMHPRAEPQNTESNETPRLRTKVLFPPVSLYPRGSAGVDFDRASLDELFIALKIPIDEELIGEESWCPFEKLGINKSWTTRGEEQAPRSHLRKGSQRKQSALRRSSAMSKGDGCAAFPIRLTGSFSVQRNVVIISSESEHKESISPLFSVDLPLSTGTPSELMTPVSCYCDGPRLSTRSFQSQPSCAACELMRAWTRAERLGDVITINRAEGAWSSVVASMWTIFSKAAASLELWFNSKSLGLQLAKRISTSVSVEPPPSLSLDCLTPSIKRCPLGGSELKRVKVAATPTSQAPEVFFTPLTEIVQLRHIRCQKATSPIRHLFESPDPAGSLFQRYSSSFERVFRL